MDKDLLFKYNVAAPRYTSYPTVPYWQKSPPAEHIWKQFVSDSFQSSNSSEGISIYVHLPFCESLCTYCGCNTRITTNHKVESRYIEIVLKEWNMYLNIFGDSSKPLIKEIHLGGGTPTFFSPENLQFLIRNLLEKCEVHPDAQFSFEAHPGNTTDEHLAALYRVGFRRISIGVQDFNPMVLAVIHRHQTYEQVCHLTQKAREIGFTSVNFDVVYGLPMQKSCYMMETMMKVVKLNPDRIAFYSYAHVPWIKPGQRRYTESDLPDSDKKMALYETGRNVLELAGYHDVGMDHFARETDSLFEAKKQGKLHRNFMGYTDTHTQLLIGLGVSAISDSWWGYAQNEKKLEDYYLKVESGHLPIFRGHELSQADAVLRKHILDLMTKLETSWDVLALEEVKEAVIRLEEAERDELVEILSNGVKITEKGKPFMRNICMAFDARLWAEVSEKTVFSQAI